jgi:hypothetical protein
LDGGALPLALEKVFVFYEAVGHGQDLDLKLAQLL